jgi:hypothetical protein
LTVKFTIQEVQRRAPESAFNRTNSAETLLVHATGQTSTEADQELFVLQKIQGDWKIARFCFATTIRPHLDERDAMR